MTDEIEGRSTEMKSLLSLLLLSSIFNSSQFKPLRTKHIILPREIKGRNKPCPCGSGKKLKLCCMKGEL